MSLSHATNLNSLNTTTKSTCLGSADGGTLMCPNSSTSGCFTQAQKMKLLKMKNTAKVKTIGKKESSFKVPPQGVGVL